VLNPPYVFGVRRNRGFFHKSKAYGAYLLQPVIHQVEEPSSLNTSAAEWYEKVVKQKHAEESAEPASYIDVRDLAEAHIRALEKPEAGGERFIVNAGTHSFRSGGRVVIEATSGQVFFLGRTGRTLPITSTPNDRRLRRLCTRITSQPRSWV
jgi:nucleoside-diphosphate-sugar epimerase